MMISVKSFMELVRNSDGKRGVKPQLRTKIISTCLVTGSGMACCLPSIDESSIFPFPDFVFF